MAEFVQIQSTVTIRVTTGLQNKDVTNPDAHVPDRLKVNPEWPKHQVLITAGVGRYPAEIVNWPSVQALAKDKILTIGASIELDERTINKNETDMLNTVIEAEKEFKISKRKKDITLNDLSSNKE